MEYLFKNFDLKKEIMELVECYFNPPSNWKVNQLGIYKHGGSLHSFCSYIGQGLVEPVYNETAEYIIEISEDINNYFDVSHNIEDYTEKEKIENINFIYENILEKIKQFESES